MKKNKMSITIIAILIIIILTQQFKISNMKTELSNIQDNYDNEFKSSFLQMISWLQYDFSSNEYTDKEIMRFHTIGYGGAQRATLLFDKTTFSNENKILGPITNIIYYYIQDHPPNLVEVDYNFNIQTYEKLMKLSNDLTDKQLSESIYDFIINY